jgi:sRNA-binding regulator protein Hfq
LLVRARAALDDRLGFQNIAGGCPVNRKLIRPTLAEVRERGDREPQHRRNNNNDPNRKRVPPEQTHAESFYYKKQMDNRTPMVLVLQDGEELRGSIEWYDRGCIKLHRNEGPNLLVLKHYVKYMYKVEDAEGNGDSDDRNDVETPDE